MIVWRRVVEGLRVIIVFESGFFVHKWATQVEPSTCARLLAFGAVVKKKNEWGAESCNTWSATGCVVESGDAEQSVLKAAEFYLSLAFSDGRFEWVWKK